MKKVVSATLAGALAVGMVPAMALADDAAPEVVADDALELLTMTPAQAFQAGEVSAATTNAGAAIADLDGIEFQVVANKAQYVKPTTVQPGEGKAIDVTDPTKFTISYLGNAVAQADGSYTGTAITAANADTQIVNPGKYAVVIEGLGDYAGAKVYLPFTIVAESLKGAAVYEVKANPADVSDKTFVYNGVTYGFGTGVVGIELNGKPLDKATEIDSIGVYKISTAGKVEAAGLLDAGNYIVKVVGAGKYAGSEVEIPVAVEELNLENARIALPNLTAWPASGIVYTDIIGDDATLVEGIGAAKLSMVKVSDTTGSSIPGKPGEYTYKLSVIEDAANPVPNFTGSKTMKFIVAQTNIGAAYLNYGTDGYESLDLAVDYSAGDKAIDLSKFVFCSTADYDKTKTLKTNVVAYKKNADGSKTQVSSVANPGEYVIEVAVDAAATSYKISSDVVSLDVTVTNGVVANEDMIVLYDGTVVSGVTKTYDGKDAVDLIELKVKTENGTKTLVAGTDYNYTIKKGTKAVTEIVDEGTYTLTFTAGAYNIGAGNSITITVNPVKIESVRVADQVTVMTKAATETTPAEYATGLPFTGKEIVPSYEYFTQVEWTAAKKAASVALNKEIASLTNAEISAYVEWVELPADLYTAKLTTEAATKAEPKNGKVDQIGAYAIQLAFPVAEVNNYEFEIGIGTVSFNVISASVFKDVPAGKWYTEPVMNAYTLGYMNGIGGGLFDPNGVVTRGQAACILFNMAGEDADQFETVTPGMGFVTPFEDVEPGMWYAQAIQWAEKAGVVNGYAGTDNFGPNDPITREQWAAMLANYAKVYGGFEAPAADALAGFADAAKVSGWAEESVAWAVENGIMGNGGAINPKADIIRAEAAAMAVNYQPKPLA